MVFDGGAYTSTSHTVLFNAITHTQGPYKCDNAVVDGWAVRTNNPPCGAMPRVRRRAGLFHPHESQMDKLAAACGIDPIELRLLNAMETGDKLITGQVVDSVAPVARCINETVALSMPPEATDADDAMWLPGGAGRTADRSNIVRGVGYGVSIKNLMYSEGFDDYSTARCRLEDGRAVLKFATAEVGQGFVTLAAQITHTNLGVDDVVLEPIDTSVGSSGSTSASRQTWMSGGAVDLACRTVRDKLFEQVAPQLGADPLSLVIDGYDIVDLDGGGRIPVAEASAGVVIDETVVYRHRPTVAPTGDRPGPQPRGLRLRRPPRRRRCGSQARPRPCRADRDGPGRGVALNPLSVVGQIEEQGIARGSASR